MAAAMNGETEQENRKCLRRKGPKKNVMARMSTHRRKDLPAPPAQGPRAQLTVQQRQQTNRQCSSGLWHRWIPPND